MKEQKQKEKMIEMEKIIKNEIKNEMDEKIKQIENKYLELAQN